MVCKHLRVLENEMIAAGILVTFRGKAWSHNCREWVYFDCLIDCAAVRKRISFPACVEDHEHLGTHDGQESGFVCTQCQDGIMGVHQQYANTTRHVYQ